MSEILRNAILIFIGLSSGTVIAGGVFAFISMIGIIPRLMAVPRVAGKARLLENMVILGGTAGNIIYLFSDPIQKVFLQMGQSERVAQEGLWFLMGVLVLMLYGIGAGVFVGCLAMALAEGLKVIPIMIGRIRLEKGLPYVLLCMALGKMLGALYQYSG